MFLLGFRFGFNYNPVCFVLIKSQTAGFFDENPVSNQLSGSGGEYPIYKKLTSLMLSISFNQKKVEVHLKPVLSS